MNDEVKVAKCEPIPALLCSEHAVKIKRKRFGICINPELCCSGCKARAGCKFVCPELKGEA